MPKQQSSSASTETQISDQIKYLSIIIYLWMNKTNNWGGFTKAAITQHYCYHLLNILLSTQLTSEDLDKFDEEIDRLAGKYNLTNLLPDVLLLLIKEFKIEIQGKSYGISEVMEVNKILESSGSKKRICAGFYGTFRSFIFGEVTEEKINDFNIYYIEKEIARTPNNPLLIVAVMEGQNIFIRKEACELLFYQKWAKVFESSPHDPYSQLSQKIKRKTLSLYGIKNKDDLVDEKEIFLKDMMTNYLYHEIGHSVSPLAAFTTDEAALGEGSTVLGSNILVLIKEFLADFMLHRSPFQHMLQLAEGGKADEAQRLFYLYLSDNFFYDTNNLPHFPMTDFVLAICVKYLGKDRIVFFGLKEELDMRNQNGILFYLIKEYKNIISWLKEKIERTEFIVAGKPLDFKNLSVFVKAEHMKAKDFISEKDLKYQSTYWANIFKHVESYANETFKQIQYFLEEQKLRILDMLLDKIASEKDIEEYKGNLRDYLTGKLSDLL